MKITIIGAGSWGTALAHELRRGGREVTLWGKEPEILKAISEKCENPKYFPGRKLASGIIAAKSFEDSVTGADLLVVAVPSSQVRSVAKEIKKVIDSVPLILNTAKGIEDGTYLPMVKVLESEFGNREKLAVLSGPSFAAEVIEDKPTAVVVASYSKETAEKVSEAFHLDSFRIYTSSDVTGVELGGVLKNIYAIAVGVVDGMEMGANARAALITRGLAEMTKLIVSLGGEAKTVAGLSGLGDLILTATSDLSRNRRVGLRLAKGEKLPEIIKSLGQVAEGVTAARLCLELSKKQNISMPIVEEICRLLDGNATAAECVKALLSRSRKEEG